jgi:hypothetical protein
LVVVLLTTLDKMDQTVLNTTRVLVTGNPIECSRNSLNWQRTILRANIVSNPADLWPPPNPLPRPAGDETAPHKTSAMRENIRERPATDRVSWEQRNHDRQQHDTYPHSQP